MEERMQILVNRLNEKQIHPANSDLLLKELQFIGLFFEIDHVLYWNEKTQELVDEDRERWYFENKIS